MRYTPGELIKLRGLFEEDFGRNSQLVLDFDVTVLMRIKLILSERSISGNEVKELFDSFLDRFFKGHQIVMIKWFLYQVLLEDIPLHVNENMTKTFLKWRMIIRK